MELDLQSLHGLPLHSCTYWLRPRNRLPSPRICTHTVYERERYWSAKIDDISLWPPGKKLHTDRSYTYYCSTYCTDVRLYFAKINK